jgi:hypothetical protein
LMIPTITTVNANIVPVITSVVFIRVRWLRRDFKLIFDLFLDVATAV